MELHQNEKYTKLKPSKLYLKPNSRLLKMTTFIGKKEKQYIKWEKNHLGDAFILGYGTLNFLKLPLFLYGYYILKLIYSLLHIVFGRIASLSDYPEMPKTEIGF